MSIVNPIRMFDIKEGLRFLVCHFVWDPIVGRYAQILCW